MAGRSIRMAWWCVLVLGGCATPPPSERGRESLGAAAGDDAAAAGVDLAPGGGLRLAVRDAGGPFSVSTKHVVDGRVVTLPHPSTEWDCKAVTAGNSPDGKLVLVSHVGCHVAGPDGATIDGDFDVFQLFTTNAPGDVGVRAWVHNRLAVGMESFRMILRIDPSSMPASGDDVYAYFANDELVRDPVGRLTYDGRDTQHAFLWTGGYEVESAAEHRGFYANRGNTKPVVSIHTPSWGLVLHETDPANAQTGTLLLGSNEGALELGYLYLLPHDLEPGNGATGPLEIGAGLRAVALPAEGPPAEQYWEAAAVYRAWAAEAGLIPAETLPEAAFPARWAQDCLYEAFNVGFDVNVDGWADAVERLVAFNTGADGRLSGAVLDDGGQRNYCVLLWSWSHSGPYTPGPGVLELLDRFQQIEADEGVQIHPMIYILSAGVEEATTRGTFLEDTWLYDELGNPYVWDGVVPIDPGHPAFQQHVADTVDAVIGHGVEGVYFDSPFAHALRDYRRRGGVDREMQLGLRDVMNETADRLTAAGGGVIAHELAVAGLPGLQGGSGVMMPGASNVPFSEALWHDRQIGAFAGDLGLLTVGLLYADDRYDTCHASGACEPGLPDNLRHVQRLAIEGAVYGRAGVEIPPGLLTAGWLFEMTDGQRAEPLGAALYTFVTESMPNALAARRRIAALRTGRMLRPPRSDSPKVDVAYRVIPDGQHLYVRPSDLYPSALYEDLEHPGTSVLVVGNPTPAAATVTFTFERETVVADGRTLASGDTLAVTVPPRDITSVTLLP